VAVGVIALLSGGVGALIGAKRGVERWTSIPVHSQSAAARSWPVVSIVHAGARECLAGERALGGVSPAHVGEVALVVRGADDGAYDARDGGDPCA
jgi:hypothetical protein